MESDPSVAPLLQDDARSCPPNAEPGRWAPWLTAPTRRGMLTSTPAPEPPEVHRLVSRAGFCSRLSEGGRNELPTGSAVRRPVFVTGPPPTPGRALPARRRAVRGS